MKLEEAWILEIITNPWNISITIADMKRTKKLILTVEEIENIIDIRNPSPQG